MGYSQPEEILLPVRFLTTMAHMVTVVTLVFSLDETVEYHTQDGGNFQTERKKLEIMVYLSIACLGVEFLGLLSGATMFLRGLNCFHSSMHFAGSILTWFFISEHWAIDHYIPLLIVFNGFPFLGEVLGALAVGVLKLPIV